jgi:hypothetical protein
MAPQLGALVVVAFPPDFLISIYAVIASEAKQSMDTAGEEWIASSLRSSQ